MNPLAQTLNSLASAMERAGIEYAIGGSMASSARGVLRATFDVDVVAAISPAQAPRLAAELGPEWYADPDQMREAIATGRAFNVIHIALGNKVDVFPVFSPFQASQLRRATRMALPLLEGSGEYPVSSADDILLAKLQWYRAGGGVSERQWTDILGILAANSQLDLEYVRDWAGRLELEALLERAIRESRTSRG